MQARFLLACAALGLLLPSSAAASVNKCRGADGRLTYQELPCEPAQHAVPADIPASYPAPNVAERSLILRREAELDRRLEAQRDRLSAEAIARISRVDPAPAIAEPAAAVWWPAWSVGHSHRHRAPRNAMREWSRGQLR
jgi:hypothetical protein